LESELELKLGLNLTGQFSRSEVIRPAKLMEIDG